ncbi:M1 family metallopeptidase [Flavobacteriaceae bacterium]|uniref:M1 family metallopeptidase n=1 Tax=Candidatus Arcticimaribacter forsetii TaxID=2820661 RepID=UPI002076DE85|nr:M1 family metallopeptidase [Candidatus Arcticimaribacter forsetii]MDA8698760.1 M1 family metallopeptidase [Flavobacteriaceae bacterium]MDB2325727.1 M1 family metallopeptidase [Flavobacteriaceae bacterium]MDB4620741.1 M1 family metallopeptidase [Flavobacteriaceae bacterium]MDB4674697.1 M1 family metallopeptidase [Flavobacteriaceae bacterium]MDB4738626.1 M1 family metallopeptidase [Flavobacteriaceae bacterium]
MKYKVSFFAFLFIFSGALIAQDNEESKTQAGHKNTNNFKQLYEEFATPNRFRTASGAPGVDYYQQQVDYVMDIELDDANKKLYGKETITYTNNSPDELPYLWVQLDQNIREKDAPALEKNGSGVSPLTRVASFATKNMKDPFEGGFNIEYVRDSNGKSLKTITNQTMMRVDLPAPLKSGQKFVFSIKWWYNINDHVNDGGRSGYEYFAKDDNRAYVIAQFFPRLAVYNDVEGWQNYQFWGNGEFALNFGNYEVNITVPEDHIMEATGELQNPKEVLSRKEYQRYKQAQNTFDKPVLIVTQDEVIAKEATKATKKSTWKFVAENVRDFGFATSRRFIWDMMAVKVGDKNVIAASLYPKEGNPLWEEYSTEVVAHTLEVYSKFTFDYPYPKAVSVHAKNQGMEYPMICWNYGRPNEDGTYSDRVKYGMISVIIHEVGHNYFPMIVNSDERQWGWMDEGLDTFMQYLTEQELDPEYPSRRGEPSKIVRYMSGDQDFISPIMSNPENVFQLGPNAYGKPATALNILRETIMGKELFDYAFKTYAQRWMFKHPSPEDFFRTMEDASAVDLDWFWRGWFYSTDVVDIGLKSVKRYHISPNATEEVKEIVKNYGMTVEDLPPMVFMVSEDSEEFSEELKSNVINSEVLRNYLDENSADFEGKTLPKFFYEIEFEKPGGIVMPIIVEYEYADGSKEQVTYPVQVWRKNPDSVKKAVTSDKEIIRITIDPNAETADVDLSNNAWPKEEVKSDFDKFKETVKG